MADVIEFPQDRVSAPKKKRDQRVTIYQFETFKKRHRDLAATVRLPTCPYYETGAGKDAELMKAAHLWPSDPQIQAADWALYFEQMSSIMGPPAPTGDTGGGPYWPLKHILNKLHGRT